MMAATRLIASTETTQSTPPALVHKTNAEARIRQADEAGKCEAMPRFSSIQSAELAPPFSDDQIDTLADAIAQLRDEFNERIATLEGQLSMLMTVIGNGAGAKEFEASEVVRKLRVR
jgi:hypothetical protein